MAKLFVVLCVAGALFTQTAHAWESHARERPPGMRDSALDVAVDANGDVVAYGGLPATRYGSVHGTENLATVKFSGQTGQRIWQSVLMFSLWDLPEALAVDAAGNPVIAGRTNLHSPAGNFGVFKLSGVDGQLLWGNEVTGTRVLSEEAPVGYNAVRALTTDGAGDVVAAGRLDNTGTGTSFAVLKFSGGDGQELWRVEIDGDLSGGSEDREGREDQARAVAVDSNGDIVAAGSIYYMASGCDLLVTKLSGSDGSEIWRKEVDAAGECDRAYSVAIDSAGDVFVGGPLQLSAPDGSIVTQHNVWKLGGGDGAVIWQTAVSGAYGLIVLPGGDVAARGFWASAVELLAGNTGAVLWSKDVGLVVHDIASDSGGNVVVSGRDGAQGFIVRKLARADGSQLWHYSTGQWGTAEAVAVDGSDDVVAAGRITKPGRVDWRFGVLAVVKLRGSDGADVRPVSGALLHLRDDGVDPSLRSLRVVSRDGEAIWVDVGGAADPTVSGATLELLNPATGELASLSLPAANWRRLGEVSWRGFHYEDPAGPCRRVRIRAGRRIEAKCRGSAIGFTLDEPSQGLLAVRLTVGPVEYCMVFGGEVVKDASTSSGGPAGRFKAVRAPRPDSCPFPTP